MLQYITLPNVTCIHAYILYIHYIHIEYMQYTQYIHCIQYIHYVHYKTWHDMTWQHITLHYNICRYAKIHSHIATMHQKKRKNIRWKKCQSNYKYRKCVERVCFGGGNIFHMCAHQPLQHPCYLALVLLVVMVAGMKFTYVQTAPNVCTVDCVESM